MKRDEKFFIAFNPQILFCVISLYKKKKNKFFHKLSETKYINHPMLLLP